MSGASRSRTTGDTACSLAGGCDWQPRTRTKAAAEHSLLAVETRESRNLTRGRFNGPAAYPQVNCAGRADLVPDDSGLESKERDVDGRYKQKGRVFHPASPTHSTLRTALNSYPMPHTSIVNTPLRYPTPCPPPVTSSGDKPHLTSRSPRLFSLPHTPALR